MEPIARKGTKENMEDGVPEADNLLRNKDKTEQEEEKESNGGILNNLIYNLMAATATPATTTNTTVDDKSGENSQKSEREDEDEKKKESTGSGILEKIISHLPEDAVPTTEEASILIHSVID
ncbi:unnamed protein product [Eruca vesicaria subsp. sativa]|uniref:Uncharacterized protein n=1 Tax=Eruca vesicaria subsp. sativa TaxID=29727 RepID=A0ABC8J1U5_ERUVS|nr:unnamed protein product [Eruca vesicaria subsp. sativa]